MILNWHGRRVRISNGHILTGAVGIAVAAIAIMGWHPIPDSRLFYDPRNFVRHSRYIANAGSLHEFWTRLVNHRDPPLRYLPLALLYVVFQPETQVAAEKIAALHAHLAAFVLTPAALAYLLYRIGDGRKAIAGIVGVGIIHYLQIGRWAMFGLRRWQDELAMPLIYLGILGTFYAVEGKRNGIVLVGGGLGIAALIQPGLVVLIVPPLSIAYLLHDRYRELLLTGIIGGAITIPGTLVGSASYQSRTLRPYWYMIIGKGDYDFDGFVEWFASIDAIMGMALIAGALVVIAVAGWQLDDRRVFQIVLIWLGVLYLPLHFDFIVDFHMWSERLLSLFGAVLAIHIYTTLRDRKTMIRTSLTELLYSRRL